MEDIKSALIKALQDRKQGGLEIEISMKPEGEKKKEELNKYGLAPEVEKVEGEDEGMAHETEESPEYEAGEMEEESEDKKMAMKTQSPDQLAEEDMAAIDKSILGGEDPEEIVARLSARPKLSIQEGMALKLARKKLKEAEQSKLA